MAKIKTRSKEKYVENQAGWQILFFSLAFAGVAGLGFRLYFSPDQVKEWVQTALARQHVKYDLDFERAELRLSRGAIPQLAIVLSKVSFAPHPECHPEPSLKVAELDVPFRFFQLLAGKVSVGIISGEDIVVDLDGFKKTCDDHAPTIAHESTSAPTGVENAASSGVQKKQLAKPWWTPEQLASLQNLVSGFEFSRVELQFEERKKKVILESFELATAPGDDTVRLNTNLRIPPEVTYGEILPPLTIEADAKATSAEVSITAALSEGNLEAIANLAPGAGGGLDIEAKMSVADLPLSTTVPLLTKAGLVKDDFKPKFLWLDCTASIKGKFQGLLREQPLFFEGCSIDGNGGKIRVESAVRHPNGSFDPFRVAFQNVDLRKMVETFGAKGPDGIATDFGRVTGALEVKSAQEAKFDGVFEGAQVRFSNRSVRALQGVARMHAQVDMNGERMTGSLDQVELEHGRFDGHLRFDVARDFKAGSVKIQVKELLLNPLVQKVLVAGRIGSMGGDGEASIADGRLASVKGAWKVESIDGREFRLSDADVRTEYGGGDFRVTLHAPKIELSRDSSLFVAGHPIFFGHRFNGEWIPIGKAVVRATVSESNGLQWERAEGTMEDGKIELVSVGALTRERALSGWVSVDYPSVKKLKWTLGGTSASPVFTDDSKSLSELRRRMRIDDGVLGLPSNGPEIEESAVSAVTTKTTRSLRALGEKVIEKAKEIVPRSGAVPVDVEKPQGVPAVHEAAQPHPAAKPAKNSTLE